MTQEFIIKVLENEQHISPFEKWYYSVKDKKTRRMILLKLKRISLGNLGDYQSEAQKFLRDF